MAQFSVIALSSWGIPTFILLLCDLRSAIELCYIQCTQTHLGAIRKAKFGI